EDGERGARAPRRPHRGALGRGGPARQDGSGHLHRLLGLSDENAPGRGRFLWTLRHTLGTPEGTVPGRGSEGQVWSDRHRVVARSRRGRARIESARPVDLYEYQGKELFRHFGIPVSDGRLATTPEEARTAAADLGGQVVVKAQVLTGGRGKAGGVRLADDPDDAE